ncbi:hypothetical protein [Ferrimicrobium sp.]|uniref:DUF6994 family protein n=1 Tax=Ferrimicrobium sp. TaxID=2926050 RepID=UPI002601B234|nr:hypothetical protein [Ferrimicrobium sp.]
MKLACYREFFALFGDFTGHTSFFLLQDLVGPDFSFVRFLHPFTDFAGNAVQGSRDLPGVSCPNDCVHSCAESTHR